MRKKRITIFGRYWTLLFERLSGKWGDCSDPHAPHKTIRIDPRAKGKRLLEILHHEHGHACDWHRDEESIEQAAKDFSEMCYRAGYELVKRDARHDE